VYFTHVTSHATGKNRRVTIVPSVCIVQDGRQSHNKLWASSTGNELYIVDSPYHTGFSLIWALRVLLQKLLRKEPSGAGRKHG
jgi:hypothetical protein